MGNTGQFDEERTFNLFSRLPAELRWKIWALNLPGPRLVFVRCGSEPSLPDSLLPCTGGGCTSSAPIPANLHVCHESRSEAFRRYRLSFGIARQPGRVFFDPDEDILYFGPRSGFMASEAQLRTVLTLCCPDELQRVRKVAINTALFWVYESNTWGGNEGRGIFHPASLAKFVSSSVCGDDDPTIPPIRSHYYYGQQQRQLEPQEYYQSHRSQAISGAGGLVHASIATSLLAGTLQLLRMYLPGLRELVFVPRDENPLYSRECCLAEPTMVQSRLARQVREAMAIAFANGSDLPLTTERPSPGAGQLQSQNFLFARSDEDAHGGAAVPWTWKIMTLSAGPDPPVYDRRVLGWEVEEGRLPRSPIRERKAKTHQQRRRTRNHKMSRE